jgi:hypothetical protein
VARDRQVNIVLKARDEASKVFQNVSQNTLPQFAKRVAQTLTAFASVGAVEEVLRRSVNAALEAEKATAGLAAALRAWRPLATRRRTPRRVSRVALADDEAIQGAQKILVSVGGLLGAKLDQATKSALDLAAGLGIDLAEAATMVAKAAQGSVVPFTRLGFAFQKNATDAEKLDAVLAGVQQRFGGMAAAEIDTTAGKIHELSEAFGELLETFGTRTLDGAKGVTVLTGALRGLNDALIDKGFLQVLLQLVGPYGLRGAAAFAPHIQDAADAAAQADPVLEAYKKRLDGIIAAQEEADKSAKAMAATIGRINERTDTQIIAPVEPRFNTSTDLSPQHASAMAIFGDIQVAIWSSADSGTAWSRSSRRLTEG